MRNQNQYINVNWFHINQSYDSPLGLGTPSVKASNSVQLFIGKDPAVPRSEKASSKKRSLLVSKLEAGSRTEFGLGSFGQDGLLIPQQIIVVS